MRFQNPKTICLHFFLILFCFQKLQAKNIDELYQNINVTNEWLKTKINYEVCSFNDRFYLGCIMAINKIAVTINPNWTVVPAKNINQQKVIFSYSDLAIIETVNQNPIFTFEQLFKTSQEKNKNFISNFKQLSDNFIKKPNASFDIILNQLLNYDKTKITEFLLLKSFNNFLQVAIDPHSHLMSNKDFENMKVSSSDETNRNIEFSTVKTDQGLKVISIPSESKNSPTELQINDIIVEINDINLASTLYTQSLEILKNSVNKKINIVVLRQQNKLKLTLDLKSGNQQVVQLDSLRLNKKNVGYIKLVNFTFENSCYLISDFIQKQDPSLGGYILDLRENPGGFTKIAQCIGGLFIGKDKVLFYTGNFLSPTVPTVLNPEKTTQEQVTQKPLVILINSNSASASEIMAAGIKDYNRGLIIGTNSFGKGTFQGVFNYFENKELKQVSTVGYFYSPNGHSNQLTGVSPDLMIYKNKIPNEYEKWPITEANSYLYPLSAPSIKVSPVNSMKLNKFDSKCIEQNESLYDITSKSYEKRDFQLLMGLSAIDCM